MRWRAVLIREGAWTDDGRCILPEGTTWDVPLHLLALDDDGLRVVGTLDRIWRDGPDVWAEGTNHEPPDWPWYPTADVEILRSTDYWRADNPRTLMHAVTLRYAVVSPADKTAWPDLALTDLAD